RSVLGQYFDERFYLPDVTGKTRGEKAWIWLKTLVYWAYSSLRLLVVIVITSVIAIVSLKLFQGKLLDLFQSVLMSDWSKLPLISTICSWLNTTIWTYFNFKKSSILMDVFTPLGMVNVLASVIEVVIRPVLGIIALAAATIVCFIPVLWPLLIVSKNV